MKICEDCKFRDDCPRQWLRDVIADCNADYPDTKRVLAECPKKELKNDRQS
jgi:hypothetical protein